ncbi:Acyl-CoA synthetase (AMP-forming)/AMP-acid ligase II [Thermomonospora echinospora]|uniref:Acyl-CoA synthetase (AMP-forming)/AMP-acid ligase II n=1 Tax=Thermomonospora echinospora TaxID=1992 RepID=A0A1H6E9S2_9ACTN|nr:AMP-binding protein [Thermomonospora echinospora]SEG93704.1 Acyl-CoA synthetase (AMP-forming)/AMP-acid ligase II [Thermomonospora echinospora]
MTIPGMLREAVRDHGARLAVVDGDVRLRYRDLAGLVERAARAYLALGTRPGDRVAIWMPNRYEFIVAMLGAQSMGAVVVPMNTRYRGHEAAQILARSRSSVLVTSNGFLGLDLVGMLRAAAAEPGGQQTAGPVPGLPHLSALVNVPAGPEPAGTLPWEAFLARAEELPAAAARAAADRVSPDDVCDILFTSGTTGRPKGVMSAHRQTVDVARIWARGAGLTPEDRYAVVNPFFHGFGYKAGVITSFTAGAAVHPVPVFDADRLLELIERERITVMPGTPTLFVSLLDHPRLKEHDLSSLRFATAGAATVPETLFSRMREELGFDQVAQAYGLTECMMVSRSRPDEDPRHVAETTGPAVDGVELRLVSVIDGADAPPGEDGEILVRGRNVMLGYFEDEEATRAVIDPAGWLHTGDVGRLDEHGCLKITDRLKDMFTVGGFNVYPAEVENVLAAHPDVSEAAVVARPDPRMGSVATAYVVARPGAMADADALIAHCRARLAGFKTPREVVFVEVLPRNASGKILKTELRVRASHG